MAGGKGEGMKVDKRGRNGRGYEGRNVRVEREVMAGGKGEWMTADKMEEMRGGRGKQCQGREGSNGRG